MYDELLGRIGRYAPRTGIPSGGIAVTSVVVNHEQRIADLEDLLFATFDCLTELREAHMAVASTVASSSVGRSPQDHHHIDLQPERTVSPSTDRMFDSSHDAYTSSIVVPTLCLGGFSSNHDRRLAAIGKPQSIVRDDHSTAREDSSAPASSRSRRSPSPSIDPLSSPTTTAVSHRGPSVVEYIPLPPPAVPVPVEPVVATKTATTGVTISTQTDARDEHLVDNEARSSPVTPIPVKLSQVEEKGESEKALSSKSRRGKTKEANTRTPSMKTTELSTNRERRTKPVNNYQAPPNNSMSEPSRIPKPKRSVKSNENTKKLEGKDKIVNQGLNSDETTVGANVNRDPRINATRDTLKLPHDIINSENDGHNNELPKHCESSGERGSIRPESVPLSITRTEGEKSNLGVDILSTITLKNETAQQTATPELTRNLGGVDERNDNLTTTSTVNMKRVENQGCDLVGESDLTATSQSVKKKESPVKKKDSKQEPELAPVKKKESPVKKKDSKQEPELAPVKKKESPVKKKDSNQELELAPVKK
eukprot:PhF_6_TR40554/c0_g1_i4/m.60801